MIVNVNRTKSNTKSMHHVFLGWPMIALTFLLAVVTQGFGIYHFSMLKTFIAETIEVSQTEVSFAYSFYALSMAIAGLIVGSLIKRAGLKRVLLTSSILYGGSFILLSVVNSLPLLYITYILMGIGSSFGGVVVITSIPNNWFVKHRGTANGIIWSATFIGSLFVTNFIAAQILSSTWQHAALILGVIAFVVILAVSLFLKWCPQDVGLLPDGLSKEEENVTSEQAGSALVVGLNIKESAKTVTFWALVVAIFLTGVGEMGVLQNTATFIVSSGHTVEIAAALMSLIGFIGFLCKNFGGVCIDKFGVKAVYVVIEVMAALGLLLLAGLSSESSMIAWYGAIALFGIGENAAIVCFSSCTGKFFGVKHYAQIFSFIFLAKALGDAIGAPLISALAASNMGWHGAFVIAAIACLVSAGVLLLARKEPKLIEQEDLAKKRARESAGKREAVEYEPAKRAGKSAGNLNEATESLDEVASTTKAAAAAQVNA